MQAGKVSFYSEENSYLRAIPSRRKKAIDDLMDIVAETDSRLMAMIEKSAEDSALSELAEGGKVKEQGHSGENRQDHGKCPYSAY